MKSLKITAYGASDVGRERKSNEDAVGLFPEFNLFIVADGMGGHAAGEIASRIAVEIVHEYFSSGKGLDLIPPERLSSAIRCANLEVVRKGESDIRYRGMGTTVVALLTDGEKAVIGHIGDSRGYLVRDGKITQLTYDHSLVNQYVKDGLITQEEAKGHPLKHILTRALGISLDLTPDIRDVKIEDGDIFILCSDGLTNMVEDRDILSIILTAGGDPSIACSGLIEMANQRGGEDNISVIVIRCSWI